MTPELQILTAAIITQIRATKVEDDPDEIDGPDDQDDIARAVCHMILRKLDVDGMCGCRLCCS